MRNSQSLARKWLVKFALWYLRRQALVDSVAIGVAIVLVTFGGWYE